MSIFKRLAGETMIYGMSYILPRILHYIIFTFYLTYKFTAQEDYGIYLELYAYAAILLVLYKYGMETAFFRFSTGDKGDMERSFSSSTLSIITTTLVFTSVFVVLAPDIARWLQYPDKQEYVYWFAAIIGIDAITAIPFARYRLENRPVRFAVYKIFNTVFTIILVVFFLDIAPWMKGMGWDSLLAFYDESKQLDYVFISNLMASSAVLLLLIPQFRKIQWRFNPVFWKKMLLYGLPLTLVAASGVINQSFSIPIIKYIYGSSIQDNLVAAGIYGAAAKLALIMNLFTIAFNYAAEPFFFSSSSRKDSPELYAVTARAFALFGSIFFLGVLLYKDIIVLVLGPNYRADTYILPILLMSYIFLGLYYNISIWYKLKDKTHIGAIISIGGAVVTLLVNFIFIPKIGTIAAAWASFTCYASMMVAGYYVGKRFFPIPYDIGRIAYYILLSLGFYWVSLLIREYLEQSSLILIFNTFLFALYFFILLRTENKWLRKVVSIQ
jgi:O-antigen/teichoic acid export membrane protein